MQNDDRIALGVLAVIVGAASLGLMWLVRASGRALFGAFASAEAGVGWSDALLPATGAAVTLIVLFALVAGDGLLGELPTVLVGFFALVAFFTFSIAWVF